jgi:DnaJ-domain-containing protein 1
MNDAEIEAELRSDLVGQRPTWPLGWRVGSRRWQDPLRVFADEAEAPAHRRRKLPPEENEALTVFDLQAPFTLETLKARYKVLVKRHHPDANGGSKESEERLKIIIRAYALLKSRHFG